MKLSKVVFHRLMFFHIESILNLKNIKTRKSLLFYYNNREVVDHPPPFAKMSVRNSLFFTPLLRKSGERL